MKPEETVQVTNMTYTRLRLKVLRFLLKKLIDLLKAQALCELV